ncbi:13155_t:CDS:2 [Entrophospora sp. SA101]|nr:13155_t:CDS:2 [Entrophospora sp. SA101]
MHRKELSVAQREQIIGAYISGVKQKVISAQLDIPTSTINDTIKQYKETGFATPEKCPSCPKLLTQFRKYLHDEGLEKQNWEEEWKNVIWLDESRFALFESDG